MAHLFHTLKRTKQWHHTHIKHTHRSSQTLSTHIPSCTTGAHRSPSHLRAFLLFYTDAASLQLHACHTRPAGRTSCSANPICRHCFMSFTTCPPEQKQPLRTTAKHTGFHLACSPSLSPATHTLLRRLIPYPYSSVMPTGFKSSRKHIGLLPHDSSTKDVTLVPNTQMDQAVLSHSLNTRRSSQTLSTYVPSCTTGAHSSPSRLRGFLLFYTDAASLQLHGRHTRPAGPLAPQTLSAGIAS